MKIMHLWCKHNFWPTKNTEGLEILYENIMSDFRKAQPCTFEEALAEEGDLADATMLKRSWFIIDSVLKGVNHEQVKQIVDVSNEEEQKYTTQETIGKHMMFSLYETDEQFRKFVETVVREDLTGEVDDLAIARHFMGQVQGEYMQIPLKYLKMLYAGLCVLRDSQIMESKYINKINELKNAINEIQQFYAGQIQLLVDENEHLKQLNQQNVKINKVYVAGEDKIELLKQTYEAQIAELEDKLRMYKEQLDELTQQTAKEEYLPAFTEPVYIAYFGLKNQLLEEKLVQYNVFIKLYSPYDKPTVVPNLPIVFNIDVASHIVWNQIRDSKPLIVTGSNARLIAERIVKWLQGAAS